MRKWIVLLLSGALLIGLLSGCAQNPFSADSRVKDALEKVYDAYGADALSLVQEIEMSFSGREQDMTMTQSSRASFVGRGTDKLTFHMDSDGSSSIDGEESTPREAIFHYEDGIAYAHTDSIYKRKQAMTADEFLAYMQFEIDQPDSIAADILKDGKADTKGVTAVYDVEGEGGGCLEITETTNGMLKRMLEYVGLTEEWVTVSAYECQRTYDFDGKTGRFERYTVALSCELQAFGEEYVIEFHREDTVDTQVDANDVPSLFGQKSYTEQDLHYLDMFVEASRALTPFATATVSESKSFSMTAKGEEYALSGSATATQQLSADDVQLSQKGKQKIKLYSPAGKDTLNYDFSCTVKEGVMTSVSNDKKDVADWQNPFYYYAGGALWLAAFDQPEDRDLASLTFSEKDGKLTCRYALTSDAADALVKEHLAILLGDDTAEGAARYIKDGDYTKNSGTLVLDMESGAVVSHKLALNLKPTLYNTTYTIKITYSMAVSDTTVAVPPTDDDEVAA